MHSVKHKVREELIRLGSISGGNGQYSPSEFLRMIQIQIRRPLYEYVVHRDDTEHDVAEYFNSPSRSHFDLSVCDH